jgi:hypothetical protein
MLGGLFLCGAAMAQTVVPNRYVDLAITGNADSVNFVAGSTPWLLGGGAQLDAGRLYKGFGLVADFAGAHAISKSSSGVGIDMLTATFGPSYRWKPEPGAKLQRLAFTAHALVGVAHGFNSVFPFQGGAQSTDNSLAFKVGGNLDMDLSKHFAARLIQADWLYTQFPNSTNNVQNHLSLAAGIVFHFR